MAKGVGARGGAAEGAAYRASAADGASEADGAPEADGVAVAGGASADPPVAEQFLVEQEHFSGTLGELAHALRTSALEPSRIDLYQLVRAYLRYFERHAAADLELATEALPRLAQVIELKARLLLPKPPRTTEEDEEEAVAAALEAVALLEELEDAILFLRRRREERRLMLPAKAQAPDYPRKERALRATPRDLARLAGRYRMGGYFELAIERLTLASMGRFLLSALRRVRSGALWELLGARDWPTRTIGLAALLELVREGRVSATQEEPFGPIVVAAAGAGAATGPGQDEAADDWTAREREELMEAPAA